jgi:hypothetical protein
LTWSGLGAAPPEEVVRLIDSNDVTGLGAVTEIGGTPVDMARLVDAPATDLADRLTTLRSLIERSVVSDTQTPGEPGEVARTVLQQSKYDLQGESMLDRLGALLLAWFDQLIDWLTSALGGPTNTALVFLAIVSIVGFTAFRFLARRRSGAIERHLTLERLMAEGGDPADLEDRAAAAAAGGDFATAVRMRFLAGLLRLDMAGRITFRPGLTTGEIAETIDDRLFDQLASDFNDIAYGGREAGADLYRTAIAGWDRVLDRSQTPVMINGRRQ